MYMCSNSYFVSITTVETMTNLGFRFVRVAKTATKNPNKNLSSLELTKERGYRETVEMKSLGRP